MFFKYMMELLEVRGNSTEEIIKYLRKNGKSPKSCVKENIIRDLYIFLIRQNETFSGTYEINDRKLTKLNAAHSKNLDKNIARILFPNFEELMVGFTRELSVREDGVMKEGVKIQYENGKIAGIVKDEKGYHLKCGREIF